MADARETTRSAGSGPASQCVEPVRSIPHLRRFPGSRGLRFLTVLAYLAVQIVLAATDGLTADESRHLRDGALVLESGRIDVNPEHPPLLKILAASTLRPGARRIALDASTGNPMEADARFAAALGLKGLRLLLVRLPTCLLGGAALLALGELLARRSASGAALGTLLLAASPPWLAHGHYVTTDVAPVAFVLLALLVLIASSGPGSALLGGALAGAALTTKFSSPLVAPFLFAWVAFALGRKRLAVFTAGAAAVFVSISSFAARGMSAADVHRLAERAFEGGGLGGPAAPAPFLLLSSDFIAGVHRGTAAWWVGFWDVANRSGSSLWVDYWMGRVVAGPEPLYPFVTLAFKNSLPFLGLVLAGMACLPFSRARRAAPLLCLFGGLAYLVLAARSSLHLGVRHLLPVVVLMAVVASFAADAPSRGRRRGAWLLAGLHLLAATASFPYYVSERNLLSRLFLPASETYDLSDCWGQDLGWFLRQHAKPVVYTTVLHYRFPEWRGLLPQLRATGEGNTLHLVDRLTLDLARVRTRTDIPLQAHPGLTLLGPILDEAERIAAMGRPVPIRQPTLLLFELDDPPRRPPGEGVR